MAFHRLTVLENKQNKYLVYYNNWNTFLKKKKKNEMEKSARTQSVH